MLIRNAEVAENVCDVRLSGERIAAIAPAIELQANEDVIDAGGCALLPGLHDHHIHMQATAAAMQSIQCGPPAIATPDDLARALHAGIGDGWLRGVGYHPSIGMEIDRSWLDTNGPDRPIRIQHRSGRMWVLNSQAIERLDFAVPSDGRLIDSDAQLRHALASQRPDMRPLVTQLIAHGVAGITDTTPGNDLSDLAYLADQCRPLRLNIMGGLDLNGAKASGRARAGPLKLHYHDHDLPPLTQLAGEISDAHDQGRTVAIHCVTRAEIMLALAAYELAGSMQGDRIEHAAIADQQIVETIAEQGLTVVTQPHFICERESAYLADVEAIDLPHLWPLRRFAEAGIPLAAGSDAPFGGVDPWRAMASACRRPAQLSPEEAITPQAALALFNKPFDAAHGPARQLENDAVADLCLIDRDWRAASRDLASVVVRATWIGGTLVHDTISSTNPQSSAV